MRTDTTRALTKASDARPSRTCERCTTSAPRTPERVVWSLAHALDAGLRENA